MDPESVVRHGRPRKSGQNTHTSKQREMRPRGEAGDEQFAATDGGEEKERRRGGEDAKEQLRSRCTDTGGRLRVAEWLTGGTERTQHRDRMYCAVADEALSRDPARML